MSILINGLGMPNANQVRPFYLKGNGDGTASVYEYTTGMQTGVAVPLPEKHGKIIDGDALWENMTPEQEDAFQKGLAGDIELFEILEAAHAIIEAEGGGEE